MSKFEPNQFSVNEAWIVFQLSDAPVITEENGDFHILGLMDAADGYMLGTEFVSVSTSEASQFQAKHLLKSGQNKSNPLPSQLIIQDKVGAGAFIHEAKVLGVEIVHAASDEIWPIIGEAVEGFRQHISTGHMQ